MNEKQNPLFVKADLLAKEAYQIAQKFPKHEMYGLTSQLRRAGLSVILNIVEGFARQSKAEFRRFLIISFGSLKETKYLLNFAKEQKYLTDKKYSEVLGMTEEVARILWSSIKSLK
ncbi:MAG: four helix bundle protein [Candidatus Magasanikbacteria bacterium]|nr:four helix bundle protein [Candidatus Magasanikbacteria bacterium]